MNNYTKWKIISLTMDQIEIEKSQFNWFPKPLNEKDVCSILKNGIRLPILVHEVKGNKYVLVDGFKRLKLIDLSYKNLKNKKIKNKISCIVFPRQTSFFEMVMVRFETLSIEGMKYPGVQVFNLLKMLKKNRFSNKEIIENVLPRLELESSSRLYFRLIKIANILEKIKEEKDLSFPEFLKSLSCQDLLSIYKFLENDFFSIIKFITIMEVTGKKLHYMLKELYEICRARGISVKEILQIKEFNEILSKKNVQIAERYRLMKQQLNFFRYPKLIDLREKFSQSRKKLKLPQRISLECDNFFEDEDLILTIEFSSLNELKKHIKYLEEVSSNNENASNKCSWEEIFSLLQ